MLKLKTPLLALSISAALLAPQLGAAQPLQILPLGDSITNGVYNPGNTLAYRDDLYDLLKNSGKVYGTDFEFTGTCTVNPGPNDYANEPDADLTGQCKRTGTQDGISYDGVKLRHEGRAGWHASRINQETYLGNWLGYYYADIALVHLGTNDIFQQENDINKNDDNVELITYEKTLESIEGVIAKLKIDNPSMKIYVAKILPMGKVEKLNGERVPYNGGVGDAAKGLNDLMTPAWAAAQGVTVTVVDMNTGFNINGDLDPTGMVHPTTAGEVKMADRWFSAAFSDVTIADPEKSELSADSEVITANDKDLATISFTPKNSNGDTITTGVASFKKSFGSSVTMSEVGSNNGTFSVTVKRTRYAGTMTVKAYLDDKYVRNIPITFKAGQEIKFAPQAAEEYAKDKIFSLADVGSSLLFGTTIPTTLPVTLSVKPSSSVVCEIGADKKVTVKSAGDCVLVASSGEGVVTDDNLANKAQSPKISDKTQFGAATEVEHIIKINKAKPQITFDSNAPTTMFVGGSFTPNASSNSGGKMTYGVAAVPANTCSINASNEVMFGVEGVCTIIASQKETKNYTTGSKNLKIKVSNDKVTLPNITAKTFGVKPFNVTATSSAGSAVTLTANPAQVCTVSGNTVTVVGAGECTLTAKTAHAEATTSFTVKKNASQLAIDTVGNVIASGAGTITVAQLEPIKGLKNLKKGHDYTKALKAGTYKDKKHPTVAELQKVVDKENSDSNKSGGSISALWLLMLGFVGLFRRKS